MLTRSEFDAIKAEHTNDVGGCASPHCLIEAEDGSVVPVDWPCDAARLVQHIEATGNQPRAGWLGELRYVDVYDPRTEKMVPVPYFE